MLEVRLSICQLGLWGTEVSYSTRRREGSAAFARAINGMLEVRLSICQLGLLGTEGSAEKVNTHLMLDCLVLW
jgi:hypothetical protein